MGRRGLLPPAVGRYNGLFDTETRWRGACMTDDHDKRQGGDGFAATVAPLGAHLNELRARIIICLVALGGAFIVCWLLRQPLLAVLRRPHVIAMREWGLDEDLRYLGYFAPIVAQMKACAAAALLLTSPLIIYQVWAFVAPGLFPRERFKVVRLGAACLLCLIVGVCFGYFVFVPIALTYLIGLSGPGMAPSLTIDAYLSTFFLLTLALGIVFQTPVVVFYLVRWGVIDVAALQRHRGGVILCAFVVGAVLTPPDPLTQAMMAVTLVVLYDLGGLIASPSRATFLRFIRFTGIVLLVVGGVVAWQLLHPLAEVTGERFLVDGRRAAGRAAVRLRRGARVAVEAGGRARIVLPDGAVLVLVGKGSLRLPGPAKVGLLAGTCLIDAEGDKALQLTTAQVLMGIADANAKMSVAGDGRVTLKVRAGQVTVRTGEETEVVKADRRPDYTVRQFDSADREQWKLIMGDDAPTDPR